ncbi:hypothetical protein OAN61_01130, partial [bacterium]|nr:hypothetical protein [bacterium]
YSGQRQHTASVVRALKTHLRDFGAPDELEKLRARFVSGTSGTVVEQSAAISAQLADLGAVRGELRRNLLQCNAKRDELSAQLEQTQSENSGLLANVGELETMATDALAMAEAKDVELAACNQRIHALERQYKEVSKQMEDLDVRARALEDEMTTETVRAVTLDIECEVIANSHEQLRAKNAKISETVETTKHELQQVKTEFSEQALELDSAMHTIDQKTGEVKTMQEQLEHAHHTLCSEKQESNGKIATLNEKLASATAFYEEAMQKIDDLIKQMHVQREEMETKNTNTESQLAEFQASLSESAEQLAASQAQCTTLTGELEVMQVQNQELQASVSDKSAELTKVYADRSSEMVSELKSKIFDLETRASSAEKELVLARTKLSASVKEAAKLAGHQNPKQKIAYLEKVKKELTTVKEEKELLEKRCLDMEKDMKEIKAGIGSKLPQAKMSLRVVETDDSENSRAKGKQFPVPLRIKCVTYPEFSKIAMFAQHRRGLPERKALSEHCASDRATVR